MEVIGLGAARSAPLAPGVEHDDFAVIVLQGNGLIPIAHILAREGAQRLALRFLVVDDLFAAGRDELEVAAGSNGVLSIIGVLRATGKRQRDGCRRQHRADCASAL